MLSLKETVSLIGLQPETGIGIAVAEGVYSAHGVPLVLTSVTDGKHRAVDTLHPKGYAFDCRLPSKYSTHGTINTDVFRSLQIELGPEWDVVLEVDHIHVEYDPKPKETIT